MVEGGVDHAVRGGSAAAQALEIFERAAVDFGASRGKRRGARVRAGKAENLCPAATSSRDDGGADESGRAGNKNTHEQILRV